MFTLASNAVMLAAFLGGWEVVLILAVMVILLGAKRLPEIANGFGDGLSEFRKELDRQAHDAGKGLGGIYGKPAAEALSPDNQTAELYDPAVFQGAKGKSRGLGKRWLHRWSTFLGLLWRAVLQWLKARL